MTYRPEEPAADLPRRLKKAESAETTFWPGHWLLVNCLFLSVLLLLLLLLLLQVLPFFFSFFFLFLFFSFLISFSHWLWHQDGRFWANHFGGDGGESVALGRKLTDWLVTGSCSVGAAASGIRPKYLSVPAHISVAKPVSGPAALHAGGADGPRQCQWANNDLTCSSYITFNNINWYWLLRQNLKRLRITEFRTLDPNYWKSNRNKVMTLY